MKDAMGETTFTIIIIVAAGLILAFVTTFLPTIINKIKAKWTNQISYNINVETNADELTVGNYTVTI